MRLPPPYPQPSQLIARLGRWLRDALHDSYLLFFKPEGLLAASGWDKDKRGAFWAERMQMVVPSELVDVVFPFLKGLKVFIWGCMVG